jgi:hypothetical protein
MQLIDTRFLQVGKGKGEALRTGFEAARGDIIVMLDAGGSTDPREIPVFVGALLAGAELPSTPPDPLGSGPRSLLFIGSMHDSPDVDAALRLARAIPT